jgi:hypothetical protein
MAVPFWPTGLVVFLVSLVVFSLLIFGIPWLVVEGLPCFLDGRDRRRYERRGRKRKHNSEA